MIGGITMEKTIFKIFSSENFIDLNMYQFGKEHCEPAHMFGPAKRNHYLFHYIISGSGVLYADDKKGNTQTYQLHENQGFMIFPNQINTYIADTTTPWHYIWIEFDGLRAKTTLEVAGFSENNPIYNSNSTELSEKMLKEMEYIVQTKNLTVLEAIGHLYLFLNLLEQSNNRMKLSNKNNMKDFYIHEALTYIENNFQKNITVEEIAQICNINRIYFGKIFKESLGKSPQQFILEYKMTKATELLKLTQLPIKEVGIAIGYENQFHFSRAFKKIYGVSPSQWKKEHIKDV